MAANDSPNDLQQPVADANSQGNGESGNSIQDAIRTTEAGEAPKADDVAAQKEPIRNDSQAENEGQKREEEGGENCQPSKLKVLWGKLGLDPVTLILMFK
jgi:hypothetical protein